MREIESVSSLCRVGMVGLQYASIDTTKQSHSQECALMVAKNYNQASPE